LAAIEAAASSLIPPWTVVGDARVGVAEEPGDLVEGEGLECEASRVVAQVVKAHRF